MALDLCLKQIASLNNNFDGVDLEIDSVINRIYNYYRRSMVSKA